MKKLNILNKGIIGVTTVACVLLAAGIAYGNNYVSNSNANSAKQGAASAVAGTNTAKKITADEAKNIALAHAKLAQKDVTFVKAELETDNNRLIYDVDFYSGNIEYDYDIDAVTGEIISSDLDIENYNIPAQTTAAQQETAAPAADIGVERAKEIALAHAGLSNDKVSFVKAQLDNEDGVKVYDVEFYSGNVEYDYEISVADGTIISADQDIENYSIPAPASTAAPESTAAHTVAQTSEISAEKAKQIALSHAGLGAATFTKVELDTDDGIKVYEIEFKVGNVEYEYDINVSNGAIIKSSSEIDD
jgi:peptidase propeptide and YPEB domain protein